MRTQNPEPSRKLQGIAYARALNKLRAYATGLDWDIRLKNLDGTMELSRKGVGMRLKYMSTTTGGVSLVIDPNKSEAVVTTTNYERYVFPIMSKSKYIDDVMGGIEQATRAFALKVHSKKPRQLHVYN